MLGPPRGPITSDRYVAGWRLLSGSSTDPQFCTALQTWLCSRLRCAPTTARLPSTGLEPWHSPPDSKLHCARLRTPTDCSLGVPACPFMGTGVSLIFYPQPFTPRWLRPFCHFDPISSSNADVRRRGRNHRLSPQRGSPRDCRRRCCSLRTLWLATRWRLLWR